MATASGVCFVDTECTGLDPDLHEIWEVGLITPDDTEHHWFLPVDLGRADPIALRIGRFYERYPETHVTGLTGLRSFAAEFAHLTRGMHLCGAVVSFDAERLRDLLRANGQCEGWHYHLIDVEALAAGYLAGWAAAAMSDARSAPAAEAPPLPWKSHDLSRAVGVDPDDFDRHTALGDARWVKAIHDAVMGPFGTRANARRAR